MSNLPFWETWAFWGQLVTMGLQLGGALLIAWLTVRWALSRYKAEKAWERETAAFSELIATITELKRINDEWLHNDVRSIELPQEESEELRRGWWANQDKLKSTSATASLVLEEEVGELVHGLVSDLRRRLAEDLTDQLYERDKRLVEARDRVVAIGRQRVRR